MAVTKAKQAELRTVETSIPARMDRLPWGPGRFARALKAGVEQGRFKRSGFGRYAPIGGGRGRD